MSTEVLAEGNVAVVTGAGSGIGEGLARAMAARGLRVALADINSVAVEAVAAELRDGGADAFAMTVDVSDFTAVQSLAAAVGERWGRTNLLVNNAGIEVSGLLWNVPVEHWQRIVEVNLNGVFYGLRAFLPAMIAAGKAAHVVNTASLGGLTSSPIVSPYIATKHAVVALTESLYQDLRLAEVSVGVSVLMPGPVRTEIMQSGLAEPIDEYSIAYKAMLRDLLAKDGLDPAVAAETVLRAVADDELWIHTHPEMGDAMINARMRALLDRRPPIMTPS
jgi:NAD(P)-dependent dehydrogenase (short-subunit alcohol dehydrogenase family)